MWLTLLASILLTAIKFLAFGFTHSYAVLTDALESIVNLVAGIFALYCSYFAAMPKDENHPYGHGKVEFLSAGFEGGLVLLTGLFMIVKSTIAFFHPHEVHEIGLGIVLSAAAGALNYLIGRSLVKKGEQLKSLLMVADGKHLMMDTLAGVGVIIGFVLLWFTHLFWIDNLVAIIIGLFILATGYSLIKESLTGLLDETDFDEVERLVTILNKHRHDKWIDIHNMRILKYGHFLHVDAHITLPWYDSLEDAHHEVNAVEVLIKKHLGSDVEFFIHSDPCIPAESCKICPLQKCHDRKVPMKERLEWTIKNVLPNHKHHIKAHVSDL